jgi:hypothetical protein
MKSGKVGIVLFILVILSLNACDAAGKPGENWKTYVGAWFEVKYPANFTVKPSLPDRNNPAAFSSAFFCSDDGQMEFYVLAPKFNMDPVDLDLIAGKELLIETKEKKGKGLITKLTTIGAKDVSYIRVIEDFYDTSGRNVHTRKVFGMKYRSPKQLNSCKKLFKKFKESLVEK